MLTLYHYWSSVCSQKVRFCLAEKDLEWESRHIDLFTFDHWQPHYLTLNPKAVVPTLDHNGNVLIESNVIVEYLDDMFSGISLSPVEPLGKSRMRLGCMTPKRSRIPTSTPPHTTHAMHRGSPASPRNSLWRPHRDIPTVTCESEC